jgi:predicted PhzF superfamily epimerase YddE/YHI9
MHIPFFQVDAFTHQPFKGNPAGICLLDTPISDGMMQSIAMENNVAETAFLQSGPGGYNLRWFSPKREMPLCGHATLATAHILWQTGREPQGKPLAFETLSGTLTATQQDGWIALDFPARAIERRAVPESLEQHFAGAYLDIAYSVDRYIVELPSAAAVRAFAPDAPFLQQYRLVITSLAEKDSPYDFVSRYFAQPVGVQEDAVTGTAHCSLATWWSQRLNKTNFFAYQASPRGGELKISLLGDRVSLSGQAVTVIEGRIDI